MSPSPNFRHQKISRKLVVAMQSQLEAAPCEGECQVVYGVDWHVDNTTVVRPDIMVVCEEPDGDFVEQTPELVAEILSDSTRNKDLTSKKKLYADQGVSYYLIVDPKTNTFQLLKLNSSGSYETKTSSYRMRLDDDCELEIDEDSLFD